MKTILEIPRPKSNSFIIWEHLMKSAVAFIVTYAAFFFGPMLLDSGRGGRNTHANPEDSFSLKIVIYFFEHPEVKFGISALVVVIMNVYIIYKNRKTKYISKIEYDSENIRLELTNLYFNKRKQVEIPTVDFEFHVENTVTDDHDKRQRIIVRNTRDNIILGEIDPKHFVWADHLVQLKNVLVELQQYRTTKADKRKSGFMSIFRTNY